MEYAPIRCLLSGIARDLMGALHAEEAAEGATITIDRAGERASETVPS